jgi:methylated-DNA-[protein]-cysteine S-methyltransferase
MCAALWTRNLAHGLPGATTPRPVEGDDGASLAPAIGIDGERDVARLDERGHAASLTPLPAADGSPARLRRVWWATRDSPFGPLYLAASPVGLCGVGLSESAEQFVARLARRGAAVAATLVDGKGRAAVVDSGDRAAVGTVAATDTDAEDREADRVAAATDADAGDEAAARARALLARAGRQIEEYLAGRRRAFDVPLDLSGATAFDRRVLAAMAAIPYGETCSYGDLARIIGSPRASRAVGHACGRNPVPLLLPCHRVVRSNGGLAGFGAGGVGVKAALLALERGEPAC